MNDYPASLVLDLDPIIVASPIIRSGTTLVQRLLCSAPNTLIYGEQCGLDFQMYIGIAHAKALYYVLQEQRIDQEFSEVVHGNVNYWTASLSPDAGGYAHALAVAAAAPISYCREHALAVNRPVWGFKVPGWPVNTASLIRHCLPRARWVFIHRDIEDSLKSAKAWQTPYLDDMKELCDNWAANMRYWLSLSNETNVMLINYHELIAQPQPVIDRIANFTGAIGIDASVMEVKINDWLHHTDEGPSHYREPKQLSEAEGNLVHQLADLRLELYGSLAT